MTALASFWCHGPKLDVPAQVSAMLRAQGQFSPNNIALLVDRAVGMGRALRPRLPEDIADRQPNIGRRRAFLLIADLRVDNRDALYGLLGAPPGGVESDSSLAARAYDRWGERFVDHLIGDFSAVVWDKEVQRLLLFRDPTGQRPLHFAIAASGIAVASTAAGVLALPDLRRDLNFGELSRFVADIPRAGPETYFSAVSRVEPGHVVSLVPRSTISRRYWQFPRDRLRYSKETDYIEAFRERLDHATMVRLRGAGTEVGSHLSSGIDSTAVTSTAARLMGDQGRVLAFTSAPPVTFTGAAPAGRAGDESAPAALMAAWYSNVRHSVVRDRSLGLLDLLKRDASLYDEPLGLPCNQVWWSAIHDQARHHNLKVMLTGESGNYTISAGGIPVLARYLKELAPWQWLQEVKSLRAGGSGLPGLLAASAAPWLPRSVWRLAMRWANGSAVYDECLELLQPPHRELVKALRHRGRGEPPEPDESVQRWKLFQNQDPGNFRAGVLQHWSLDERDVASDRELAEFMLSLPREMLLSGGETRKMARLGLAGRIPAELWQCRRGYQGADWYEQVDQRSLLDDWRHLQRSPAVREFLLPQAVEKVIESWPAEGFATGPVISKYRLMLLRLFSAAHFAASASGDSRP